MMISDDAIKSAFRNASPEVRAMVNSDDVFNAFHEIRKKYNLHLDHAGNLATAINAVILEIVPFTELDQYLREGMPGVDDDTRQKVLADVNEKIFVPLREEVKRRAQGAQAPQPKIEETTPRTDIVVPAHERIETPPPPVVHATPSVLEQKMPAPDAPITVAPPTQSAPRYHGTDPYRELPE